MTKIIRVPQDRVGAIIGKNGEVRRRIAERTGVLVQIDSESGEVMLEMSNAKDPLLVMKLEEVIKAIGRGFSPEHAYKLFEDDYFFQVMDIHDYVGKNQKDLRRIKARMIGRKGKTRRIVESMTGSFLSIYGGTVSIIGDLNGFEVAKIAVDMILNGSEHSTVYGFLERKRRESRLARLDSIITGEEDGTGGAEGIEGVDDNFGYDPDDEDEEEEDEEGKK